MAKKAEKPKSPEEAAADAVEVASFSEALKDYNNYVQARAAQLWSHEDTGHDLNIEEQLFVRSYIIDRNPVAALKRLGHEAAIPTLKKRAEKMLSKPEVGNAIEYLSKHLMNKLEITAERVQRQIAAVAFFDPRQIMEFDEFGVRLMNSRFWTEEQMAAVASVEMGQNGIKLKFYDRLRATEMLAKQLGVQPEDDMAARAEEARRNATEVVNDIMSYFRRTIDHQQPVALPAPDPKPTVN